MAPGSSLRYARNDRAFELNAMLYDLLIGPFAEFDFMRRALVGVIALSVSGAPVGVFLMLRRMSLTGDAMAHAILPGAALGYLVAGFSLPAMTLGGLVAGFTVALAAGAVARLTVRGSKTRTPSSSPWFSSNW